MSSNVQRLREALGLALVRQGKKKEALAEFAAAAKARPDESRYHYVYAVALVAFKMEAGDRAGAAQYLGALAAINPEDPALARPAPRR